MRLGGLLNWMAGVFVLSLLGAQASPIVSNVWDADQNWNIKKEDGTTPAFGTHTEPATVGGQSALQITRTSGSGVERDYVYNSSTLVGNWTSMAGGSGDGVVRSITFNFYADAGGAVDYPAGLRLYFKAGTSGNVWYYDFTPTDITSGWGGYGANVDGVGWWTTGDDSLWATDLTNVTEVGLWISYQPDYANQLYGIDNFTMDDEPLPIPEPGTYLFLGVAFLSLGVTYRRRFNDALVQARARMRR